MRTLRGIISCKISKYTDVNVMAVRLAGNQDYG